MNLSTFYSYGEILAFAQERIHDSHSLQCEEPASPRSMPGVILCNISYLFSHPHLFSCSYSFFLRVLPSLSILVAFSVPVTRPLTCSQSGHQPSLTKLATTARSTKTNLSSKTELDLQQHNLGFNWLWKRAQDISK